MSCNGNIQPSTDHPGYNISFNCSGFTAPNIMALREDNEYNLFIPDQYDVLIQIAFDSDPEIMTTSGVSNAHMVANTLHFTYGNTLHFTYGSDALHYQIDFVPSTRGEHSTITGARVSKSSSLATNAKPMLIPRETYSNTGSGQSKSNTGMIIGIIIAVIIVITLIIILFLKFRKKPSVSSVTTSTDTGTIKYSRAPGMPSDVEYGSTMGQRRMIPRNID